MEPLTPLREQLQALADAPHGAGRHLTGTGLRAPHRSPDPKPQGYAGIPGQGPEGETCGSCRHVFRNTVGKHYLKCRLMSGHWTGGRKTDVLSRSPACRHWAEAE